MLRDAYDQIVERYIEVPFSTIEASMETDLCLVPNDWDLVRARLRPDI